MRRRRRRHSSAVVGAVTLLLAVLAVHVAYTANSGVPLARTYHVRGVLPDAENVTRNAEVRLAGVRVGRVAERSVRMRPDGRTEAVLGLELDPSMAPLPGGTSLRMRSTSALGGTFVELLPGSGPPQSSEEPTIRPGARATLPSLPDTLEAFDAPTRRGVAQTVTGLGDALMGRGRDLNGLIAESPTTLRHLEGASRALGARTGPFIDGFARLGTALEPVAEQQAGMIAGLDRTLTALAAVRGDVAESAARAPALLDAGIDGFPHQQPLLRETASLFTAIAPGVHALRGAARDVQGMAAAGPPALRALGELSPHLAANGDALERFATDPAVEPALRTLLASIEALRPTIAHVAASQVVCNYPGILLRNGLSALADGDSVGNWLSTTSIFHLPGVDSESGPSAAPSNGPMLIAGLPVDKLHANPYPYAGQGPAGPECEAGNEGYAAGLSVGHARGRQQAATDDTQEGS